MARDGKRKGKPKPKPDEPNPDDERVSSRALSLEEEQGVDDAGTEARALLEASDERQEDRATRDLDDPGVIRRTSEEATPPPEDPED